MTFLQAPQDMRWQTSDTEKQYRGAGARRNVERLDSQSKQTCKLGEEKWKDHQNQLAEDNLVSRNAGAAMSKSYHTVAVFQSVTKVNNYIQKSPIQSLKNIGWTVQQTLTRTRTSHVDRHASMKFTFL